MGAARRTGRASRYHPAVAGSNGALPRGQTASYHGVILRFIPRAAGFGCRPISSWGGVSRLPSAYGLHLRLEVTDDDWRLGFPLPRPLVRRVRMRMQHVKIDGAEPRGHGVRCTGAGADAWLHLHQSLYVAVSRECGI